MAPPVNAQTQQGEAEGQEHVDAVQHHQDRHVAVRPDENGEAGEPHHDDAVLSDEARGQIAEMTRHPRIGRHVRQHGRPVQKAGLCAHQQQTCLEGQHRGKQRMPRERRAQPEMIDDAAEHHRIERLTFHRLGMPQHVQQDDAAGREGERGGHIEHRCPAVRHARLGQHVDIVRHGFEARVRAAAQRERSHEQGRHHEGADSLRHAARFADGARHDAGQMIAVHRDAVHDEAEMQHHEAEEDRQQHHDRLAHAAEVETGHQDDEREFGGELECLRAHRQQAEECIDAARERRGDGQHVVDQQRGA